MSHLFKHKGGISQPWSESFAEYLPGYDCASCKLSVGVKCRLGGQEYIEVALFDTGAVWTLIGGDTAEILEDEFYDEGESISIYTRLGIMQTTLWRLPVHLVADQGCGTDITIESTIAVAPDWTGPVVLGYRGFLERIRFALEPCRSSESKNYIYFGID